MVCKKKTEVSIIITATTDCRVIGTSMTMVEATTFTLIIVVAVLIQITGTQGVCYAQITREQ